jgi:hypothetical protein
VHVRAPHGASGAHVDVPRRETRAFGGKPQALFARGQVGLGLAQPDERLRVAFRLVVDTEDGRG